MWSCGINSCKFLTLYPLTLLGDIPYTDLHQQPTERKTAMMIAIFEVSVSRSGRIRNMLIDEVAESKLEARLQSLRNCEASKSKWHDITIAPACFLPVDPSLNAGWANTSPEEIFGDWTLDNHPSYAF